MGTDAARHSLLLVISGPSGSGKTTVSRRLVEKNGYTLSVSATTRKPRPGEVEGKDYCFMSRRKFLDLVRRGGLLEYSEHFGSLYGTPRRPVEEALAQGKVVVLEIDVNGARQVKEGMSGRVKTLLVFVNAPSVEELRRRIMLRPGTQEGAVVRERLARAEMELAQRGLFDREVINDQVERAVSHIEELVEAEARSTHG